jgi:hypothetical protein
MMRMPGLTDAQRISLQRELVAIRAKQVEANFGDNRTIFERVLADTRTQLVSMLLDAGDVKGASAEWSQVPKQYAETFDYSAEAFNSVTIRLASRTGTLDALLQQYRDHPESSPSADALPRAAATLRGDKDENGARAVLEFLYDREIRNGHLDATNFLGLAEVKLQRGDAATGVALMDRMALVVADGFETLMPAAELLGKYGKTAESAEFIRRRIKAVPWDSQAKVALARTLSEGSAEREQLLTAAETDADAAYRLRAEAARLAAPHALGAVSGTELALLSSGSIAPDAAEKPYQVEARIDAAGAASDPEVKLRLWREALALAPTDGRARLGALRAAIALRRDSLALSLEHHDAQPGMGFNPVAPYYRSRGRYRPFRQPEPASVLPQMQLTDAERAAIAEALAAAAERLDDLEAAVSRLRTAIDLRPPAERAALQRHLDALTAEQNRRAQNAARQPAIKDAIEQDQVVRPRILKSAPGGAQ